MRFSEKGKRESKERARAFRERISYSAHYISNDEKRKKQYFKEQNGEKCKEMQNKIDELINSGKSSGVIKKIIEKLYPEIATQMGNEKVDLGNGKKTDRLSLQIQYRVEKFRKSVPKHYNYEGVEKTYLVREGLKETNEMDEIIDELIQLGQSLDEIKEILKEIYPNVTTKMENEKINLENGETTDRLTAKLQGRRERYRKSLKKDDGRE